MCPLKIVEALGLALAAMPHLRIGDRDAAVLGDAAADARLSTAVWVRLEILLAQLTQRFDVLGDRRKRRLFSQIPLDPCLQAVQLLDERHDRGSFLLRIGPLDVQRPFDARLHQQRSAGLIGHFVDWPLQHARRAHDELTSSVRQQVERVFDAADAFDRP